MKINLIFLDIDGVLITYYNADFKQLTWKSFEALNYLIEKTGAKIVITSTWRLTHGMDIIRSLFKGYGCIGEIIDGTPDLFHFSTSENRRGDEIMKWVKEHNNPSFVVIDDNIIDIKGSVDNKYIIKTDKYTGLTMDDIKKYLGESND